MKNKFAFTLAEVLITLVIIGVVAALTIPTAINKYRDEELKSQFKKAYSTISQAVYKTEMNDFYGYARCYYNRINDSVSASNGAEFTDCPSFFSALRKHLQIQKVCDGNAKEGGCVPEYQTYSSLSTGCPGFQQYNIENHAIVLVLSNGQILIPYSNYSRVPLNMFLLDINGMKGPNAYGKDLFAFVIERDTATNSIVVDRGMCEFPVSGGRTTRQMIRYALAGKK